MMSRLLVASLWLLLTLCCSSSLHLNVSADTFKLHLMHTSSIRGRVQPETALTNGNECNPDQARNTTAFKQCVGGFARRLSYFKSQKKNNTLLVDTGNSFWGTNFLDTNGPEKFAEWTAMMPYDVIGIGTGDFFSGPEKYSRYVNALGSKVDVVCSNIDISRDPFVGRARKDYGDGKQSQVLPWVTRIVNGTRIGIIGITEGTLTTSSSPGKFIGVNSVSTYNNATGTVTTTATTADFFLRLAIAQIQKKYPECKIIIALSAATTAEWSYYNMISKVTGISVWVNGDGVQYTNSSGNYPVVVSDPIGNPVLMVQNGERGTRFGNIEITFDTVTGIPLSWYGDNYPLTNNMKQDPEAVKSIEEAYIPVLKLENTIVGTIPYEISGDYGGVNDTFGCRYSDCPIDRIVCDSMLDACPDCDVAAMNVGGIRSGLFFNKNGNVSRADIQKVLPFGNTQVVFEMKGDALLGWVKYELKARYNSALPPARPQSYSVVGGLSSGNWQHYAGLRVAYNPSGRQYTVSAVQIRNRRTGNWSNLDPAAYYKITTNNFIRTNYKEEVVPYVINPQDFGPPLVEVLVDYLKKYQAIGQPIPSYSREDLVPCWNASYTLLFEGDTAVWPNDCRIIVSTGVVDTFRICPTNYDVCTADEIYPGKAPNTTRCNSCSGMGSCALKKCTCDAPVTTGPFAGIQMIAGSDCSEIRSKKVIASGLNGFLYFMTAVTLFISIFSFSFYAKHSNEPVVKRSAVVFLQIACFGAILGAIATILMLQQRTDAICNTVSWLAGFAFNLTYGALLIKTYRIYKIFKNQRLVKTVLTDVHLLRMLGAFLCLELILRIVEIAASPQSVSVSALSNSFEWYEYCTSTHFSYFTAVSLGYKAIFVILGLFLAVEIRDIDKNFNESKSLGFVIYHLTLVAIIVIIAVWALGADYPTAATAIQVIAVNYLLIVTQLGMLIPKAMVIHYGSGKGSQSANSENRRSRKSTNGGLSSTTEDEVESFLASVVTQAKQLTSTQRETYVNAIKRRLLNTVNALNAALAGTGNSTAAPSALNTTKLDGEIAMTMTAAGVSGGVASPSAKGRPSASFPTRALIPGEGRQTSSFVVSPGSSLHQARLEGLSPASHPTRGTSTSLSEISVNLDTTGAAAAHPGGTASNYI